MNGRQLADRIGNIDDRLIQQAQETGKHGKARLRTGPDAGRRPPPW